MTPRKPIEHGDPIAPVPGVASEGLHELDAFFMFAAISPALHERRADGNYVNSIEEWAERSLKGGEACHRILHGGSAK